MKDSKKMTWYTLAFIAFSGVWGFGNVLNGFVYFNGIQVIFSWVLMFALYFVPYTLMVGELGSAFKTSGGGVSSWIHNTMGPKLAYYAGWTYWACHITYIASKGSGGLKALSWAVFRNAETYDTFPTIGVQLATLAVFLFFCWVASRGLNPLKKLASIAGTSMFVMSILYILLMFAAPAINPNGGYVAMDFSMKNLIPQFNVGYFTSLSILVFAVGGCEKISPFQKLGAYYGMGDLLLVLYALCNMIGQFAVLVVSIDAPLRMLLDNEDAKEFVPSALLKRNDQGAYVNGIKLIIALSGSIILVQSFVPGAAAVLAQLNKLNSVCMPLRYLWVFVAYLALRKAYDTIPAEYRFVKNQAVAKFFGAWCFVLTAACGILGMYSTDVFTMALNIITPVILTALGMIMPYLAKRERERR